MAAIPARPVGAQMIILLAGAFFSRTAHAVWDADLTARLVGEENARMAQEAKAKGDEHWVEMGVGVDHEGRATVQGIAKGKPWRHIRAGLFLVANGQVSGGIFQRSVILLVEHNANGTLGLIINKRGRRPPS